MNDAIDIAKYIVSKCDIEGYPITNLHLQKILYFIQKAYLREGSMAFPNLIEAWQFGPVVPDVYYYFSGFGVMSLFVLPAEVKNTLPAEDRNKIDPIVEQNRVRDVWDLVNETHKPGGAWDQIYQNGKGNHCVIPMELIKKAG